MSADEIVDTTGAGDAFIGGFLAGLASGYTLEVKIDRYICLIGAGVLASCHTHSIGETSRVGKQDIVAFI